MPTLDWIGKKAVINHHNEVPFHLLKEAPDLSFGDPEAGNLIVEGDNLVALKALLPYYAGQVKCIYIDPPYNTGNENWIYNDNVNSPEIRRWLGKVVGGEMEDLSRHDKWLCMMYPRLVLLKEMLRADGAIFVSIDDNEVGNLRKLLDEIFGASNFVCNFVWEKKHSRANDAKFVSDNHDFVLLYAKNLDLLGLKRLKRTDAANARYKNPDNDPRGPWSSQPLQVKTPSDAYIYEIVTPAGKRILPPKGRSWAFGKERYEELVKDGQIYFGADGNNVPRIKKYLKEVGDMVPVTIWPRVEVGDNQEAKTELKDILAGLNATFDSPKPTRLLQRIIELTADRNSIVMDSFAGSGTTAHAVMQSNAQDSGKRHFILVEMNPTISRDVAFERLRLACKGYKKPNGEAVEGLGGGFRYCKLGPSVFGADGRINPDVTFPELARHVFFTETGRPLPKQAKADTPLIGTHEGRGVYLLYNGILKDKRPDSGNVLTQDVLNDLPKHDGFKVVYGTACRFSASRLKREKITFKQIPYEIRIR